MKLLLPQLDGIVKRFFRTPPSEAVAIAKALEPKERGESKERSEPTPASEYLPR